MGLYRLALLPLLLLPGCATHETSVGLHPLPSETFSAEIGEDLPLKDNYPALRRYALSILHEGARSRDADSHLLALYGAGISLNEDALPILLNGTSHPDGRSQMAALHFLTSWSDDAANYALRQAMGSPYLIARLEAAYMLAKRRDELATPQIAALMNKVEDELLPLFPALFAMVGDAAASKELRSLLHHRDLATRHAAIIAAAQQGRDDLLPELRKLGKQLDPPQQEATLLAFGMLGDELSLERIKELSHSKQEEVKSAALLALYRLGQQEAEEELLERARNGDLFALYASREFFSPEKVLRPLLRHPDGEVRLNALVTLMEKRDQEALMALPPFLIRDSRDLGIRMERSTGGSLTCYRLTPSIHSQNQHPFTLELSTRIRESLLSTAARYDDTAFIPLAKLLLTRGQLELIPLLTNLLERRATPAAIELLKEQQQEVGTPLVRWYCNLALFRLREEGPYEENLLHWIAQQKEHEIMQFRPLVPWELDNSPHQLTPIETSRLLVESIEALANRRNQKAIEAILHAIEEGHPQNRYSLAGLLLRTLS